MTPTDVAGLPGEIMALLARAGLAQDAALESAGIPRQTYYRRKSLPGSWRVGELCRLVEVTGGTLDIYLAGHQLDLTALSAPWRLGELQSLAKAMDSGLAIDLVPAPRATEPAPRPVTVDAVHEAARLEGGAR